MAGNRGSLAIGVSWNGREAYEMMNRLVSWSNITIPQLTKQQANEGAQYARTIAPNRTGALIQAIDYSQGKKGEWQVISRTPKGQVGRTVPYQLFIHLGRYGRYGEPTHKTGDHRYMVTTARMLQGKYPELIKKSLNQKLKK